MRVMALGALKISALMRFGLEYCVLVVAVKTKLFRI